MRYPSLVLMGIVGLGFMIFMGGLLGRDLVRTWGTTTRDIDLAGAGLLATLAGAGCLFVWMIAANI